MDSLLDDLKYSLRLWRRTPVALAAVAALALGMGVNTAIFSVVNTVLLKPVLFPEPDRLVTGVALRIDSLCASGTRATDAGASRQWMHQQGSSS